MTTTFGCTPQQSVAPRKGDDEGDKEEVLVIMEGPQEVSQSELQSLEPLNGCRGESESI